MKRGPFPDLSLTCPLPEPSFTYISKSQIKRAHYSFPNRASKERADHFELSFIYILQGPQQRSPHSRHASKSFHWERCSKSKSLVYKPPTTTFPNRSSMERATHFQNHWFIHSFISLSHQLRSSLTKQGENICSPSRRCPMKMECLHTTGTSPGYQRGSFTTLLLQPQCHASFSMIPSTLAWIDCSPISQRVTVTLYRVPLQTCYCLYDPLYGIST